MPAGKSIVLELQELAADSQSDVGDLLRKALIIATKLNLKAFREWIEKELHGYEPRDQIPDYRQVRCNLRAVNPYRGLIPVVIEDPRISAALTEVPVSNSVSGLVDMLKGGDDVQLQMPIPSSVQAKLMRQQDGLALETVRLIDRTQITQVVETVRTKVLEWALRLEQEGILGEGMTFTKAERQRATTSSIQNINIGTLQGILGDVNHSTVSQDLQVSIVAGDFASLRQTLQNIGLTEDDLHSLETAIQDDPQPVARKSFGPAVSQWFGNMMGKASAGLTSVGVEAAGSLIANAIWAYYGFGA